MAKKKSLGHNPLAYSMLGNSSFEFIRSTDGGENGEEGQTKPVRIPKKVVSYYLDERIINEIKAYAQEHGTSCSGLVNEVLSGALKNKTE